MMKLKEEQLFLAVYSLRKTGFRYGMYALITGCDELSFTLGKLLLHCGAAGVTICASDREDEIKAEQMGFSSYVYDRDNIDTALKLTDGRLYDLVFETSGNVAAYDVFIDLLKRGGTAGILARLEGEYSFFVKTAVRSQIRFIGLRSFDEQSVKIAKELLERGWRVSE